MNVRVALFAAARDAAGAETVEVSIRPGDTPAEVLHALAAQHPALARIAASSRLAVGDAYASAGVSIVPEDSLALIPPVSGG